MTTLIIADHDNTSLQAAMLNTVTAAQRIGGDIHVLVAGSNAGAAAKAAAAIAGVTKVLHVDAPDIVPLSDMMKKLPLPFVIDHMGRVPAAAGVDQAPLRALIELSKLDKCWIKVCGSERIALPPYAAAVPIAHALVDATPTRVLWGTDYPHPNATHEADEGELVDLVPQFAPEALAQRRLLVDNPARLYGFD